MGNQRGRRAKQFKSLEKKKERLREQGIEGHTHKSSFSNDADISGDSKYAQKKRLQNQGIYSENSPYKAIEKGTEETAQEENLPLLTKAFNNAAKIDFVNNKRIGLVDLPQSENKNRCALGASLQNGEWTLTRYFLTQAEDGKETWTPEFIEMPNVIAVAPSDTKPYLLKQLMSSWSFYAEKFAGTGEVPKTLFDEYTLVESYNKSQHIKTESNAPEL